MYEFVYHLVFEVSMFEMYVGLLFGRFVQPLDEMHDELV